MKLKRPILLGLVLACVGIVHAANTLRVEDLTIVPGESVTFSIGLDNETINLMGWQCDIMLPEGLTLELKENGKPAATLGERFSTTGHTISSNRLANGGYRFIATSMEGEAIPDKTGTLFSVTLHADASLTSDIPLTGLVKNIEFNTQDNQKVTLDDMSFSVSIVGEGIQDEPKNELKVEDLTIISGESVTLSIGLDNETTNLMGWQCDIMLPEGLTLELKENGKPAATLGERFSTTGHTISSNRLSNGGYRFIATSMDGEPIPDNTGTLFSVTLKADASLTSGIPLTGLVKNIEFNTQDNQKVTLDDISFSIAIADEDIQDEPKNELKVEDLTVVSGESVTLSIGLDNETTNLMGWQCDIMLPEGLTLELKENGRPAATLGERFSTTGHTISSNRLSNGGYRFIATSMDGEAIPDNTGTLFSVTLKADASLTSGTPLTGFVKNIEFNTQDNQKVLLDDVTFSIIMIVNTYKLMYMLDGEPYKEYEIENGAVIIPETEPVKEGYTFSGWSEIPETMPAHDVTITGSFTINTYKLTYELDGKEYKTFELEFGAAIIAEKELTKEGYTFSGWNDVPETMPAYDVTVKGTFIVNTYKLTYYVDEEEFKSYEVEYGATISPEDGPVKEGYTFSGWSVIPEIMPAHDVVVKGTFTINTYKLTYELDGKEYKSYELEYGAAITPEEALSKEGYTFSGWSTIPETMPAHDVKVAGSFTINTYKLTYELDGKEYKTFELEYGAAITPEKELTKEGYTFSGWSDIPETMPSHDVIVKGTFTVNTYKLTYELDGKEYKTVEIDYGAAITPEEPTKEGYTFSGWSNIPKTMPAHDVKVTGSFTINTYKLTYELDGKEYKTFELEYGAAITPEKELTKEGYTFSGWSDIPETMPSHDVIVKGTFTVNKYKLTYQLYGKEYKTYEVEYGATITPEKAPVKEGYTFSGWSEIPETMPAHDVTVTGSFTINTYKLTYFVDDEEFKSYRVEYGATITPEENPSKEGYSFSGWNNIPATMPAHDVRVTGYFTINSYLLTYMIDDAVYKVVEYEYGAAIILEERPEGDYIRFEWIDVPDTMPAHDVTVYANYETGVGSASSDERVEHYYRMDGKEAESLSKGFQIIVTKNADGTSTFRKVFVR